MNLSDKVDLTIPKSKLEISKAIVANLKNNKCSVRGLAKKIGMQHPQIVHVTGGKNYNIDTLLKILDGLDLEIVVQPKNKQ